MSDQRSKFEKQLARAIHRLDALPKDHFVMSRSLITRRSGRMILPGHEGSNCARCGGLLPDHKAGCCEVAA